MTEAAPMPPAASAGRLGVDELAFGYGGVPVGRGVSFAVSGGEVLCLLGPNGSGKSTLFKTILQLLAPLAGRVAVDGELIRGWSRRRLARAFGYVPQAQLGTFPFTVRDVVLMGRTAHLGLFATPGPGDVRVAEDTLGLLGIAHLAERPYPGVSGGERQLTLIARALAQEPQILVMDEPTASLDFGNQVRVLAEIQALARRGITVILSTHDPDQAFLCAHRVALLHRGELVRVGSPGEVLTPPQLRAVYGVEVEIRPLVLADGRPVHVCVPLLPQGSSATTRPISAAS
jgi:iron complex transport system ATP-binding protein